MVTMLERKLNFNAEWVDFKEWRKKDLYPSLMQMSRLVPCTLDPLDHSVDAG